MPRSRRRHHSRSRSRSRSHSHDRDREAKRRKIDNVDSPSHKRSVSAEPQSPQHNDDVSSPVATPETEVDKTEDSKVDKVEDSKVDKTEDSRVDKTENPIKEKLTFTPTRTLSPKQVQKKLESEKKREQKRLEREERERKKQEEKEERERKKQEEKDERDRKKQEEKDKKNKEREMKREEKEAKRKEKEEKEEAKRKEREQEKLKKQQELEEKSREKQKLEEQKQKASQAFVNFFVAKEGKTEKSDEKKLFMPFEVKSDMRLAPPRRVLKEEEKSSLLESINNSESTYLKEIKNTKKVGKSGKTWPYDDDLVIIEEDFGESICEDRQKTKKMRVKFLKFHENKRPAYYGTWRKTSKTINPKKPFTEDKTFFDYDVDSDDDWEEEEQGESLNGSDDEDKENEAENDDYEVDNDFFVPHGHLSDDEVDDEELSKLSPESHKLKLKLLKDEFDEDMQAKINKMKARSIGCIWYSKDGGNVDEAIDRHLKPLAMITNGQVIINRRKDMVAITPLRRSSKELQQELIPIFLKVIQGNVNKKATVVEEFLNCVKGKGVMVEVSKSYLLRCLKQYAQWRKCGEEGPLFNKYCWCLDEDVRKKFNME